MRKTKLYIAVSLNGKIAKPDGGVDWLDAIANPEQQDYGYSGFYASIDTTIQGNNTYQQIMSWDIEFPYAGKKNYVLTSKKEPKDTEHVEFISENHADFIRQLKKENGADIWLVGGGKTNTLLLNEGLIDEVHIFIMPIILSGGIELFEGIPNETLLKLVQTKSYSTGVVQMIYHIL